VGHATLGAWVGEDCDILPRPAISFTRLVPLCTACAEQTDSEALRSTAQPWLNVYHASAPNFRFQCPQRKPLIDTVLPLDATTFNIAKLRSGAA